MVEDPPRTDLIRRARHGLRHALKSAFDVTYHELQHFLRYTSPDMRSVVVDKGDRVVVFYGQGHIYLLQQCLREQPGVELVDPLSYLAGT